MNTAHAHNQNRTSLARTFPHLLDISNTNQGRSYVEAEEAVASPVFAGLMNIMIK